MLSRRKMLSTILCSIALPKIVQSNEKPLDTVENSDKICCSMSNGIEKIFNRTVLYSKKLDWAEFHIKNDGDEFNVRFPINLSGNVNDTAWETLLAAASDSTNKFEFPIIECSQFLKTKATDVFVDDNAFRFFKYIYEEDELPIRYKIHPVNLRQYYDFYTNKLGQKFNRYKRSLFVAANLSDSYLRPSIYSSELNINKYGCIVPKNEYFRIGQI